MMVAGCHHPRQRGVNEKIVSQLCGCMSVWQHVANVILFLPLLTTKPSYPCFLEGDLVSLANGTSITWGIHRESIGNPRTDA